MVQQGRLRFVLIVPGQGRANALLDGIRQYGRPIDPRPLAVGRAEGRGQHELNQ